MEDKGENFESYENIKVRMLSLMKDKGEDFESYEK